SVLLSNRVNYWTGQEARDFEGEFAKWSGSEYSIALMNGTVALDAALKILDLGQGDEVIVTPRSFIASVSSVVNSGATPVFADVDRNSGGLSAETIAPLINKHTKAIVCVHLAGWPCEMDLILELANQHGLAVIEDCAQAHGARYRGQRVGSLGHVAAWSFCQDKIMTTGGEGGMVTTNDEVAWRKLWSFKDHGKSYEAVYEREHPPGFRWLHESFGTNWRMTEMQAAIGRIQLRRMEEWHRQRTQNAHYLQDACLDLSALRTPVPPQHLEHAWYKFYTYVRPESLSPSWSRDRIIAEVNALGVPCYSGSCSEIYLEKAFDGTGLRPKHRLPVAKELGETSLMFLVHPTLTASEIQQTGEAIKTVIRKAQR
ncbi:MAG: DegT/DnrJ/EryC1/StrS family aminotransferase, partial [Limisphaerales bacterium]